MPPFVRCAAAAVLVALACTSALPAPAEPPAGLSTEDARLIARDLKELGERLCALRKAKPDGTDLYADAEAGRVTSCAWSPRAGAWLALGYVRRGSQQPGTALQIEADSFGDSGSWETRLYGEKDDPGCPFAPLNCKPCFYETDVLTRVASEEMIGTPPETPFYVQLDYTAPHGDFRRPAGPEPAPRHYDSLPGAAYPHSREQGFNEGNVNDKPRFIREAPYLSATEIHTYRVYYQHCLESLISVDEGVKEILDELGGLGRLRNTYVIFTSDNGFFFGEHRLLGGKFLAYEPATHLPFLIRGPGIEPGSSTGDETGPWL